MAAGEGNAALGASGASSGLGLGSVAGFSQGDAGGLRLGAGSVLAAAALVLVNAALSMWLSLGLHRTLAIAALRWVAALGHQSCELCMHASEAASHDN